MRELFVLPKRWFSYSIFPQVSLGAMVAVGLAASALAGGGPLGDPPPNDECANAVALALNEHLIDFTQQQATFSGMDDCFSQLDKPDVWYKFTAPSDGSYRFVTNSEAAFFGVHWLGLYSSCGGSLVGCDNLLAAASKQIDFQMVANQTVYLRIGTEAEGVMYGLLVTSTPPPPTNDECASASALTLGVSTIESIATLNASTNNNVPPSCGCTSRRDLWYGLTAPTDGTYQIVVNPFWSDGVSPSCYDIYGPINIAAYTDCSLTQELACDVVSNGLDEPAAITVALSAGQSALVRVAKCVSSSGSLSWDIFADYAVSAPANDSCSQASPLFPASSATGSTFGATNDIPGEFSFCVSQALYNVWHSFTNPYNETRLFSFEVTPDNIADFAPAIIVLNGCGGTLLDCARMSDIPPFASRVSVPIDPGQTVLISIVGSGYCIKPSQGNYTISIDAGTPLPPNDDCANAQPLAPGSSNMASTLGATASEHTLTCEFFAEQIDVWFSITNTETFPAYYTIDNFGSPEFTRQSFSYYNSCVEGLGPVQCRNSFELPMNVAVQPGETALVRVIGIDPVRGDFQINVSTPNAYSPPANDTCQGATSLSTFPFQGSIDTANQMPTPDPRENCIGVIPTTSVGIWYQFTPSSNGDFVFVPSLLDTLSCTIFTGSCAMPVEVACRIFGDITPVQLQGGTSYLILVDHVWGAYFADLMNFEFDFTPTAPPPCPGDFNGNRSVEVADIFAFLNAWFSQFNVCSGAGNCSADINNNGTVEVADIFAFLNQWFGQFGRPCP